MTSELKQLFNSIDTDKDGNIGYTEFLAATISMKSL